MCRTRVGKNGGSNGQMNSESSKVENEELGLKEYIVADYVPFPFNQFMSVHIFNTVCILGISHVLGIYGMYIALIGVTPSFWWGSLFLISYGYLGGLGVTAGSHRLWTHKAYKANKPLQIFLMLCQTSALQNSIIKWGRDHRIHHKYTDTNADPHNATKGLWFSHIGWLINPEHPDVLKMEKKIPMGDLESDPILRFQADNYWALVVLTVFVIPITFMYFAFPQPFFQLICINYTRWIIQTQFSMLINSAAHYFGDKPFDKTISSVDNRILAIFTIGEAWHNYHHSFPYDYKASELPVYPFNMTTAFIDFCAWMGWATDLKTVPREMVLDRVNRTGDGSHPHHHHSHKEEEEGVISPAVIDGKIASWGWGDEDMKGEAEAINLLLLKHAN